MKRVPATRRFRGIAAKTRTGESCPWYNARATVKRNVLAQDGRRRGESERLVVVEGVTRLPDSDPGGEDRIDTGLYAQDLGAHGNVERGPHRRVIGTGRRSPCLSLAGR